MVDALASVAIETLRDLLIKETKLLSSVSYQVEQVERDLRSMHNLLIDADKWSGRESNTQRNWINDLRKLAHEAETVLEKYAVEVKSRKEGGTLKQKLKRFSGILKEGVMVHEVVKEAEGIRSRLASLMDELKSMSGGEGGSSPSDAGQQQWLRKRHAHEVEQHFVGMEKDIECVMSMVKDDKNCDNLVVSICGMGGLGKTTLARKIYHHKELQGCFEARVWVCVTQQFQPEAILREILKQVDQRQEISSTDTHQLVPQLHNILLQKKCLIVIDDIWERDHWDILKPAFPTTTNCRVLLTTRNENIVARDCVYKLDFLTEDQGWELLHKTAIPDGSGFMAFEDIGRQMVKKCGRLPLAIFVIGGILRQNQTRAVWEKVSGNIDSYLKHGEGYQRNNGVVQILDLSYDVLPYYLKPCFLYLACFPEDEEIRVEELYLLWIAEGLISSQDKGRNETLRDVAERYLSELAFRCMVQVQKDEEKIFFKEHGSFRNLGFYYESGKFTSCRLHDLMRDLSLSKAKEINFLKCLSSPEQLYSESPSSIVTPSSRLVIENGNYTRKDGIQKLEDLRSVLSLVKHDNGVDVCFKDSIFDFGKSKGMRILKLDGCIFKGRKLLRKMDKLIHLRYLSLYLVSVKKLPRSICNMPYLETLDLRVRYCIKLPNVIYKIKKLRHLFLGDFRVIGGDGLILGGLKELETLHALNMYTRGLVCIADIPKLTNLRKLAVKVMDMDSAFIVAQCMCNNDSPLRESHLVIDSCDFSSEEGEAIFKTILMSPLLIYLAIPHCKFSCGFPNYQEGMCRNLVALVIYHSKNEGDLMRILGEYPMLRNLEIYGESQPNMICVANSFPELKSLYLKEDYNLRKWEVEERAMPKLTELVVMRCTELEELPLISTLQNLLILMPKEFTDKLRVVNGQPGEDYHKVSHIPSVNLHECFV